MFDNIDKFLYTIKNYLINNEIIINDDYDADVKLKLYLLKYRKLIGLTLLILLLLLGYYCNPYENLFNNDNNNGNNKNESHRQRGGSDVPLPPPLPPPRVNREIKPGGRGAPLPATPPATPATPATPDTPDTPATPEKPAVALGTTVAPKLTSLEKFGIKQSAKASITLDKVGKPLGKVKDKIVAGAKEAYKNPLKSTKKLAGKASKLTGKAFNKGFDFGAAAAHKFTENTDLIYQILYSIALFIVICIVAVPSIAFLIIGIVCYFLLKDKMKTIKGL